MPPEAPAPDVRPVILGGDITAYSLIRTFHAAYGVRPIVVNMSTSGPVGLSTLCDHVYVEGFERPEVFLEAVERVGREHGGEGKPPLLLVATGDWYVEMVVEHKERLAAWYTIPYIDIDLLRRIVRKDVFYGILDEVDVPHPRTVVVDMATDAGEEADLPFDFPVVAKPADSSAYHYAPFEGNDKVFICQTPDELATVLRRVRASPLRRQLPPPGVRARRRHEHAGAHVLLRPARHGPLRLGRPRPPRGAPPPRHRQPRGDHHDRGRRGRRAGGPLPRAHRLRRASPTSTSSTTAATARTSSSRSTCGSAARTST